MAYCPSIHNLEMDEDSSLALSEILDHDDLKLKLQFVISAGHWIITTQAIRSDVNTKQLLFWRAMYNGCILKK